MNREETPDRPEGWTPTPEVPYTDQVRAAAAIRHEQLIKQLDAKHPVASAEWRKKQIRDLADTWRGWSIILLVLGALSLFLCLLIGILGIGIAGSFFTWAFIAYITAQIIHIRANTEK